jgi:uncharacterized protein
MSVLLLIVVVLLSFVIGIGASAIGMTAWMLLVPILFVVFGFDLYLTLFISLLVDCGNALIMTIIAGQHRQLDIRMALKLSLIAAVAVSLGVALGTTFIPEHQGLFESPAVFVNMLFGLGFLRRGYRQGKSTAGPSSADASAGVSPVHHRPRPFLRAGFIFPAAFLVGLQSGLFGIGGGMLYSIFLLLCCAYSTLKATGTAMMITLFTTMIAATGIFFQIPATDAVDRQTVIVILSMMLFSMIGTILGARVAYALSLKRLNYLIAAVILSAATAALVQSLMIGA